MKNTHPAVLFWTLGSLLINITITIYIFLMQGAPAAMTERHVYINENWTTYSLHWKLEMVFMVMILLGAIYFAVQSRKWSWSIIALGLLINLFIYPLMIGGYRVDSFEIFTAVNQVTVILFLSGNLLFYLGLLLLYLKDHLLNRLLRVIAITLSAIASLAMLLAFTGIINWKQALMAGPLLMILFLINAWYGLQLRSEYLPVKTKS